MADRKMKEVLGESDALNYIYSETRELLYKVSDMISLRGRKITDADIEAISTCPKCRQKAMLPDEDDEGRRCSNCGYLMPLKQVIKILKDRSKR